MVENLIEAIRWFVITTPVLAALFLVLIFLVALLQVRLPKGRVSRFFHGQPAPLQYFTGATLGTVTPFCSMTTIPALAGLLRSGVPFGPTMAFLISSPLLDGIVLGVLVFLIGPKQTALYAALTFLASMGIAALFARLGLGVEVKQEPIPQDPNPADAIDPRARQLRPLLNKGKSTADLVSESSRRRIVNRVRRAWNLTWKSFTPLLPHLLLGTAIGAILRGFLPVNWILTVAGPEQPWAIPLMAIAGLPVYINAEILLPVTAALLDKGMGVGAVVALVITGLGMSASEVALLTAFFRPRLIATLVLSFFLIAVGGGALAVIVAG